MVPYSVTLVCAWAAPAASSADGASMVRASLFIDVLLFINEAMRAKWAANEAPMRLTHAAIARGD
ncbi:hypothetical protein JCM10599A_47530 [Paraburkholderia kururiensis]